MASLLDLSATNASDWETRTTQEGLLTPFAEQFIYAGLQPWSV